MATKKQQRRRYMRAKAHGRGEDHVDPDAERPAKKPGRVQQKQSRGGKVPQPPSPRRSAQKAIIFAGLFFAVQHFTALGGKTTLTAQLVFAVWMFAMFWMIGMWTERWTWRRYLKQQEQARS